MSEGCEKVKIQIDKIYYLFFWLVVSFGYFFMMPTFTEDLEGVVSASLVQLLLFIIGYVYVSYLNRSFISLYSIFMIVFYLFQNGQVLLYSLGVEYDYFYVLRYDETIVLQSVIFSTQCLIAAFMAGVFSTKKEVSKPLYSYMDQLEREKLITTGKLFWGAFAIFALPFMMMKLVITSTSGYFAMIRFVGSLPTITVLFEKMFIASSVFLIVYLKSEETWSKFLKVVILGWSIMAALTGDRTVGLAGIVTLALIQTLIGNRKKKIKFSQYALLVGAAVVVMYLMSFAFQFRMQQDSKVSGLQTAVVEMIGTLGFSFFPLVLTIRIVPTSINFFRGKSYIAAIITGLIPSNFDFLHLTNTLSEWNAYPTELLDTIYHYGFGLDYSLIAEAYINFGSYGWIAIFFLCSLIAYFVRDVDFKRKDNLFSQYASLILLYSWFTLPRRKSYFIFNNFFWYVLFFGLALILVSRSIKQRKEFKK
ncbi:Uncharacterised protein [Streptococcus pneumoniae]|uniref:Oligosaccharide repeat unit polymerase Wzy n=3 Tax=Streptococcus pneumoniae TaxID=1313 RepID=Q4JZ50_STREE|nr:O-antigen polysaccharide polymerase Wzy family protein [Streptococcus pneumoniae]MDV8302728.1 O-antigen polysaccharide polymerase Wzy family protein [Streptococcus pneumoniae]MDV8653735.1 O-antigen polysaccharide polymerase Wzy family protein [Streptococcus pneumoniae]CAI34407.1 oligosaccharide repeat unit polymerase Wzy [Streptococcus pneumoniae]CIV77615.1 Uncharacterised protein [Streptococcus pneumoniae]CTN79080.1 oligosaccharide repeat unit polymerase Wzy [Streptococcus pneumoniae]